MRNTMLAFGSFVLGVFCTSVFGFGNPHTSTVRQLFNLPSAIAQTKEPSPSKPPALSRYVPTFPPVGIESSRNRHVRIAVDLDGVASDGEIFQDVTLRYGGGAYMFRNTTIEGTIKLELVGAARNTATLLNMLHMLGCPATAPKAEPSNPNTPMLRTASLSEPLTGTFESPYNSAK